MRFYFEQGYIYYIKIIFFSHPPIRRNNFFSLNFLGCNGLFSHFFPFLPLFSSFFALFSFFSFFIFLSIFPSSFFVSFPPPRGGGKCNIYTPEKNSIFSIQPDIQ